MWNWNTHRHENIQVLSCQSSTHRSVEAVSGLQEAQDHILYSPAIHLMVGFHFTLSTHRNCTRAYATSPSKSQRTMGMIWLTPSSTPTEKDGSSNLVKSHPENMLKQWTFFYVKRALPCCVASHLSNLLHKQESTEEARREWPNTGRFSCVLARKWHNIPNQQPTFLLSLYFRRSS